MSLHAEQRFNRGGLRRGAHNSSRCGLIVASAMGAAWFSVGLYHSLPQPLVYDAEGYVALARVIVRGKERAQTTPQMLNTLFDLRLMGYPLFLAPWVKLGLDGRSLRIAVALVQFVLHVGSIVMLGRALRGLTTARTASRITISMLMVPFPYFLCTEVLTDSLSISLAVICFSALVAAAATPKCGRASGWILVAFAASSAGFFVRVDAYYVLGSSFAGAVFVVLRHFGTALRGSRRLLLATGAALITGSVLVVSVLLFRVPQYLILRSHDGRGALSPPVSLASFEVGYGVSTLKYATGIDGVGPAIPYRNPLLTRQAIIEYGTQPSAWYRQEPLRAALSVPLRWFALVDQDMPFVYNSTVPDHPSIVLFLINHCLVALGFLGAITVLNSLLRRHVSRGAVPACIIVGALVWLGTHALPHVETRYGLPALLALAGCAGYLLDPERVRRQWRRLAGLLVIYLPTAWMLSSWIASYRRVAV